MNETTTFDVVDCRENGIPVCVTGIRNEASAVRIGKKLHEVLPFVRVFRFKTAPIGDYANMKIIWEGRR